MSLLLNNKEYEFNTYLGTDPENMALLPANQDKIKYQMLSKTSAIYWNQLSPKSYISAISEYVPLGTPDNVPYNIREHSCFTVPNFADSRNKRRVNRLDVEWTFKQADELDECKKFMDSINNKMICYHEESAMAAFKDVYNVNLKNVDTVSEDKYDEYVNRYVSYYDLLGLDNITGHLKIFTVLWYDKKTLEYVINLLENTDTFVKLGYVDFRLA